MVPRFSPAVPLKPRQKTIRNIRFFTLFPAWDRLLSITTIIFHGFPNPRLLQTLACLLACSFYLFVYLKTAEQHNAGSGGRGVCPLDNDILFCVLFCLCIVLHFCDGQGGLEQETLPSWLFAGYMFVFIRGVDYVRTPPTR